MKLFKKISLVVIMLVVAMLVTGCGNVKGRRIS